MYDVIIVGGGPAGMTAAVYAARKKMDTLMLTKDLGGQVNWTLGIENYMGFQFIEGPELIRKFEEQVKRFPFDMKVGVEVGSFSRANGHFEARTSGAGVYQGRTAIIATGKRPRPLNVAGEERLRGRGVTYCAICDGPLFSGMKVAVIGGGNSALEAANDMVKIAEHVYMVSLTPLSGDQILIEKLKGAKNLTVMLEYEVVTITGEKFVDSITIRNLKTKQEEELPVAGVLIEIGLIPNSDIVRGVAALNASGEVIVDCSNETSVPGLFAAGDVTSVPEKQIVVAAGEGVKAVLQAHRYLQRMK